MRGARQSSAARRIIFAYTSSLAEHNFNRTIADG